MTDDLPPALKRDENNVAPFMLRPDCTCGLMTGECKRAGCPLKELTVTVTDVNDGPSLHDTISQYMHHYEHRTVDLYVNVVSPEASPPASFPWERPPSGSTS